MSYVSDSLKYIKDGKQFTRQSLSVGIHATKEQTRIVIQQLLKDKRIYIAKPAGNQFSASLYAITPYGVRFLEEGMGRNRLRPDEPVKVKVRPITSLGIVASARLQPNSVWALGAMA